MKNLKKKLGKKNGFTLVEMLIVIAIIAILIAISIPMVNSSLENARKAVDQSNARNAISLAMIEVMTKDITADTTWAYEVNGNTGSVKVGGTAYKGRSKDVLNQDLTVTYTAANQTFTANNGFAALLTAAPAGGGGTP